VKLQGSCAGCPFSQMTLKNFIEKELRKDVSGVTGVEAM
jgi:Fe-S cluster biogenesis protein NfuA